MQFLFGASFIGVSGKLERREIDLEPIQ